MTLAKRRGKTKETTAYADRIVALGVCVVCEFRRRNGMQKESDPTPGAIQKHHRNLNDWHGQKQLGEHAVVMLCEYHHDADFCFFGYGDEEMRAIYGPSFKKHARDFREWTQDVLPGRGRGTEAWQSYQDELLGETA